MGYGVSFIHSLFCHIHIHIMVCVYDRLLSAGHFEVLIVIGILYRTKGILVRINLIMWLATLIMFSVSTVHYGVKWAEDLAGNSLNQQEVDIQWAGFHGDWESYSSHTIQGELAFEGISQYLPIINVSFLRLSPAIADEVDLDVSMQYIMSDIIVFWRAWILWNRSKSIAILGAIFVTGTAGRHDSCRSQEPCS